MLKVYYISPEKAKFSELPKTYNNISPFNERYALAHGWEKITEEIQELKKEEKEKDFTNFNAACAQFKEVCSLIGTFINNPDFKGGFDEYSNFINSTASQENPSQAALLATMWSGANEYAKYEGSKVGYGQPTWWYKCWEN